MFILEPIAACTSSDYIDYSMVYTSDGWSIYKSLMLQCLIVILNASKYFSMDQNVYI